MKPRKKVDVYNGTELITTLITYQIKRLPQVSIYTLPLSSPRDEMVTLEPFSPHGREHDLLQLVATKWRSWLSLFSFVAISAATYRKTAEEIIKANKANCKVTCSNPMHQYLINSDGNLSQEVLSTEIKESQ